MWVRCSPASSEHVGCALVPEQLEAADHHGGRRRHDQQAKRHRHVCGREGVPPIRFSASSGPDTSMPINTANSANVAKLKPANPAPT